MQPFALSIKDAGHYIGVSRSGIYRLVETGKLQPLKVGGKTLFRRTDLEALLDASAAPLSTTQGKGARQTATTDKPRTEVDVFA